MSLVDELARERFSENSLLHQVFLALSASTNSIVICVEGWDDFSIYVHHIRQRHPGKVIDPVRCGPKKSVLWLNQRIYERNRKESRLVFFVDRDLDDYIWPGRNAGESVYVTDFYSFENWLVGPELFDIVWVDVFGRAPRGTEYIEYSAKYVDVMVRATKIMASIGVAAVALRRSGLRPVLDQVVLGARLRLLADCSYEIVGSLSDAFGCANGELCRGRWKDIRSLQRSLRAEDRLQLARGKNLFEVAVAFFGNMRSSLGAQAGQGRRVPELVRGHLLDTLASRILCPQSLARLVEKIGKPGSIF